MTIHYVTPKVDDGPIIFQNRFLVLTTDTEEVLEREVKRIEQLYFPKVLDYLVQGLIS